MAVAKQQYISVWMWV